MSQNVGVKDVVFIVLFSTLIFFGAFFLFSSMKEPEVKRQVSIRSLDKSVSKKVNKKIQKLQTKNSIFKSKIAETGRRDMDDIMEEDFSGADEKYELDVFEYQANESETDAPQNVSEKVMSLLNLEEKTNAQRIRIIEQYKEELIEKAREQGFAIEINDDLEVTSAKKL